MLAELRAMGGGADDSSTTAWFEAELARGWSLERRLLAAANLVMDVANHVAAGHFAIHPSTYEEGLRLLAEHRVVTEETYTGLRGLGGFRHVLAHEYLDIDLDEVTRGRGRALEHLPGWIGEVGAWLDRMEPTDRG